MAISTQSMANVYPMWMKIRVDPSSNGQRFFSCFGETFDFLSAEKVLLSQMFKLFSEKLGVSTVNWVYLDEVDYIKGETFLNYTFPEVIGTLSDGSSVTIERVDDTADFMNPIPSRIVSQGSKQILPVIWTSSAPDTYGEIKVPCRLGLTVSNSKHYKRRNRDRAFPGYHMVEIQGYDENRNHVIESVYIRDDGTFKTHRIYSELLSVDYDGFDGSLVLFPEEIYASFLTDKFHGVSSTELNRALLVRRFQEPNGLIGVELFLNKFLNGQTYRNINIEELYDSDDLEEVLDSQIMLDENGDTYSVVDFTISPLDSKLWCLSSDGRVHIHTNTIQEFSVPPEKDGKSNTIEIVPDIRRVPYNEEIALYTFFRAMKGPLKELKIRRIDPDGIETYLQADKSTWSATEYIFEGNSDSVNVLLPEDTHDTIRFVVIADKLGEWNFYCDATVAVAGSSNVTETSKVGVLCSSNLAEKTYSLGLTNVSKIYFSKENYLTVVTDLSSSSGKENYFSLHRDVYMADVPNQRLLLREDYEEVEVSYE